MVCAHIYLYSVRIVRCLTEKSARCLGACLAHPWFLGPRLNGARECFRACLNACARVPVSCSRARRRVPCLRAPCLSLVHTCSTHNQRKPYFSDSCLNSDCPYDFSIFSLSFKAIWKCRYASPVHSVNMPVLACTQTCVSRSLFANTRPGMTLRAVWFHV